MYSVFRKIGCSCMKYNTILKSNYSTRKSHVRVTLCGALGAVGQPLALKLKQIKEIDELCLYDSKRTKAYAMELNLIDTNCKVIGSDGFGHEQEVFCSADIVIIAAANSRTSCLDYTDLFDANKGIICRTSQIIARHCPKALVAVVTQPINSFVPLISEQLRIHGVYDPRKIFGVTTLDSVRASTFTAEILGLKAEELSVPVIGGGFGKTIVPVISISQPRVNICHEEIENVLYACQKAHRKIVKAKRSHGPEYSAAYAIAIFIKSLAQALRGVANVKECAYVRSNVVADLRYMSTPLLLGPDGVKENYGVPCMSLFEHDKMIEGVEILKEDILLGEIEAGVDYAEICKDRDCGDICPPKKY